jgi:hypothetical protein
LSDEPASGDEADGSAPSRPGGQRAAEPGDEDQQARRSEPAWTRLIAPLRSEDAAFRMVVWAACAALTVAAIVLLVRLVS